MDTALALRTDGGADQLSRSSVVAFLDRVSLAIAHAGSIEPPAPRLPLPARTEALIAPGEHVGEPPVGE